MPRPAWCPRQLRPAGERVEMSLVRLACSTLFNCSVSSDKQILRIFRRSSLFFQSHSILHCNRHPTDPFLTCPINPVILFCPQFIHCVRGRYCEFYGLSPSSGLGLRSQHPSQMARLIILQKHHSISHPRDCLRGSFCLGCPFPPFLANQPILPESPHS